MDRLPDTDTKGVIEQLPRAVSGLTDGAVRVKLHEKRAVCGLAAWQVNRLLDYIQAHLGERIGRHELANILHISVGRLSMRFKVSTGMTLRRYIARQRVENACRMMTSTSESLSRIAVACGLSDQPHFSHMFRRMLGVSPGAWRQARLPSKPVGTAVKGSA
jgi:transcriptional regulator GlxA family with amidase domain